MLKVKEIEPKFGKLEDKKYICVIDLELTCWDDKEHTHQDMEIIEIGIAYCNLQYKILDEIEIFVKPWHNPILSDYCKELTHIKQEDVDNSKNLCVSVSQLMEKLPDPKEFIFASWGNDPIWLQKELEKKCYKNCNNGKWHGYTEFDPRFINIKLCDKIKNNKKRGLKKTLRSYGIEQIQPAHRALPDALSTALLAKEMKLDVFDCMISNDKTFRQKETKRMNDIVDKFVKKTGFEKEKTTKLMKYVDYDFMKAQNIFQLFK